MLDFIFLFLQAMRLFVGGQCGLPTTGLIIISLQGFQHVLPYSSWYISFRPCFMFLLDLRICRKAYVESFIENKLCAHVVDANWCPPWINLKTTSIQAHWIIILIICLNDYTLSINMKTYLRCDFVYYCCSALSWCMILTSFFHFIFLNHYLKYWLI